MTKEEEEYSHKDIVQVQPARVVLGPQPPAYGREEEDYPIQMPYLFDEVYQYVSHEEGDEEPQRTIAVEHTRHPDVFPLQVQNVCVVLVQQKQTESSIHQVSNPSPREPRYHQSLCLVLDVGNAVSAYTLVEVTSLEKEETHKVV